MKPLNPRVTCKDGFSISIQGSETAYASPREDEPVGGYTHVECGFPSSVPKTKLLCSYAEDATTYTRTVYPYTPVKVVLDELEAHGGIEDGCMPK